jgi:hypothetical protein
LRYADFIDENGGAPGVWCPAGVAGPDSTSNCYNFMVIQELSGLGTGENRALAEIAHLKMKTGNCWLVCDALQKRVWPLNTSVTKPLGVYATLAHLICDSRAH